mmetsp:Transcript_1263/g.2643  ORF Transcript_1263/g.2643 Transcript_1263/m.2643 type:complete len:234 (-) Transcript_1263:821-1522(-)
MSSPRIARSSSLEMTPLPSRSRMEKADMREGLDASDRLLMAALMNSMYSISLDSLMSMRRKSLIASSVEYCACMALTNSSSEMVPEPFSSILTKRSRSSSSLAGGVEKAITSMATFFMLSAFANSSRFLTMSLCDSSSSAASVPSRSVERLLIHGWLSACDALSRFLGSFCISCVQKSLPCDETRCHSADSKRTGSCMIIRFFSLRSEWWKGRFPESSMKAHTPIAHMSTDES